MDRYSAKETCIAYWGLGLYWGKAVSNNKKGHLIGHIKVGGWEGGGCGRGRGGCMKVQEACWVLGWCPACME